MEHDDKKGLEATLLVAKRRMMRMWRTFGEYSRRRIDGCIGLGRVLEGVREQIKLECLAYLSVWGECWKV